MLIPTIRMVRAALEDAITGVNAQLLALPLDTPDGATEADSRPEPVAAILDPSVDDAVVRAKTRLTEWPVLVITAEAPSVTTVPSVTGLKLEARELVVSVTYVTREGDSAQGFRDAEYTLRAAIRALNAGLFAASAQPARQRAGFNIHALNSTTIQPIGANVEGVGTIAGALLLSLHVREA